MLRLCHQRKISLAIGRKNECVGITVQLIGLPNRDNLTLFSSVVVEVPIYCSNDEINRPQAITNI